MTWSPFTVPENSKARTYASGTYAYICLKTCPGCERKEHFPSGQRASLCYLSSICFADVCRLDFLWATCVVTLSRSILWFCRTSSRCLHLQEEAEKKLSFILSMPAKQESPQCVSQPGRWRLALHLGKVKDTEGSWLFSPSAKNSHKRSRENFIPGAEDWLKQAKNSDAPGAQHSTSKKSRALLIPLWAASQPYLCSLCSTMRHLWHVSTSQVSQNSLSTSCVCRGQYKAKSPEPPFTPARQYGESGLHLLRKTSQLSPTEQALALNGGLHGYRGDTELQG